MRNIAISILLPVYNGDDTNKFEACLDAVKNEMISSDQLLIIVDGPINNSLEFILSKYTESLKNIEVIQLKCNSGLITALNLGLSSCRHEYVARIDADDIVLEGRFCEQIKMLETGVDVVSGAVLESGGFYKNMAVRKLPESHLDITRRMRFRNPINHMATMFRLSKILSVGKYPNLLGNEDYALWLLCRKSGFKFKNTNKILVEADVPVDFARRRRGWKFAYSEFQLLMFRRKNKLGNFWEIHVAFIIRFVVRLLPSRILRTIYTSLRRSHDE